MTRFADHFSRQADRYARFRPSYPTELFALLGNLLRERSLAWDCATGNGQVALSLTALFSRVMATEPSMQQLAHRRPHERVSYIRSTAQACGLRAGCADLVTVGQALHWFAGEAFFREVRRVVRPGGLIAAWGYGLCAVTPAVDALVEGFCEDEVGPYWPPERRYLDEEYETLPFPFPPVETPSLELIETWTAEEFLGYLGTWSAVQRFRRSEDRDPMEKLAQPLLRAWGGKERKRSVIWPLFLRVGWV